MSPKEGGATRPPPATLLGLGGSCSWLGIAVVLVLTFAVYSPTLRFQFVHDDIGQIVENPAVHTWRTVPEYFTTHVWHGFDPQGVGNYYRPVFLLWLRVNDAVFSNHPWGWHFTSVSAHLLATFLIYLLFQQLGISQGTALLATLIFALHPAHVEAVAWISGVTEPLLAVFLAASFLFYLPAPSGGERAARRKFLSLAFFVLAILEKETAVVLPGFLLAYECLLAQPWRRLLGFKNALEAGRVALGRIWAYFLVILLYLPARHHALHAFSHVVTPLSWRQMVCTWPELIWFWSRHLLWPVGLSTFSNLAILPGPTLKDFVLPGILDLAVGLLLLLGSLRSRQAAFWTIWLVLPLIPVLNLRVFDVGAFASNRYLYLPSVGWAMGAAWVLRKLFVGPPRYVGLPVPQWLAAACLAGLLSYGTVVESRCFRDNLTFCAYNFAKAPHSRVAEFNYGINLQERGLYSPAREIFADLTKQYPDYWEANYRLALTDYQMGRLTEAEDYFLRVIHINPGRADAYLYLGMVLFRTGQISEAVRAVREAVEIQPQGRGFHFALGVMLKTQGDYAGARAEFQQELANYPEEAEAAVQLREVENRLRTAE